MHRIPFAALALAFALTAAPARAEIPTTGAIAGTWRGITAQTDINFKILVKNKRRGDDAGEIQWSSPKNCENPFEFIKTDGDAFLFIITKGNGPFCDRLRTLRFSLTPGEGGTLNLELKKQYDRPITATGLTRE